MHVRDNRDNRDNIEIALVADAYVLGLPLG